jgi:hypothetical protein
MTKTDLLIIEIGISAVPTVQHYWTKLAHPFHLLNVSDPELESAALA